MAFAAGFCARAGVPGAGIPRSALPRAAVPGAGLSGAAVSGAALSGSGAAAAARTARAARRLGAPGRHRRPPAPGWPRFAVSVIIASLRSLSTLAPLTVDDPALDPDEARRLLEQELQRGEYQEAEPAWFDIAGQAIVDPSSLIAALRMAARMAAARAAVPA